MKKSRLERKRKRNFRTKAEAISISIIASAVIAFVCVLALTPVAVAIPNPGNATAKILVDMTHGERLAIDGIASNLYVDPNVTCPGKDTLYDVIVDATAWADDMRGQGYAADLLTAGPVTADALSGYNMFAVIEPDNTTSGPAYFTQDEADAIRAYVDNGGGLLLIGDNLLGTGSSLSKTICEYYAVTSNPKYLQPGYVPNYAPNAYIYAEILNDLTDKAGINVTFGTDMLIVHPDNWDERTGGPNGNVWVHTGNKSHALWTYPNTYERFGAFHVCSLDIDPAYQAVAWGSDTEWTVPKNSFYEGNPTVKPMGSNPVVMAAAELGSGRVVCLGAAQLQGTSNFGDVYWNEENNLSRLHQNIAKYLVDPTTPKILVDLTHAERISIDNITSPNLNTSGNERILNWTDWADHMRGEGYIVAVLTVGPISTEKLAGYEILVVAEPDVTTSGPAAYFTTEESAAIGTFVENGGGLLLMGTQLVGGSTFTAFMGDYDTVYHYPEIHNALLENLSVGMRFAEGMIGPDPYDTFVDDDIVDQVGGPKGNVWIDSGEKTHPIWNNVTDGKFAYWHGCSINVTDGSIDIVATGDDNTYTSVKNSDYSPVVKPSGSYPVAIAAARYGTGKIVAYGDAGCWQGTTPFGELFTKTYYNEQEIASSLMAYLCEPFELKSMSVTVTPGTILVSVPTIVTINVTAETTGAPINGANVTLSAGPWSESNLTTIAGECTFNVTSPFPGTINVTVTASGYNDSSAELIAAAALPNMTVTVTPGTILKSVPTVVTINVTAETTGAPINGANVTLSAGPWSESNLTTIAGECTFNVTSLYPGTINVTVAASGYNDGSAELIAATALPNMTVTVTPGTILKSVPTIVTINVTAETTGAPINGATVTLSAGPWSESNTTTNGECTFNVTSLYPGTINVTVVAPGYNDGSAEVIAATELPNMTVTVTPGTILKSVPTIVTINVTDETTGAPINGATVTLSAGPWSESNLTTIAGECTFNVTSPFPGTINVTVAAPGYNDSSAELIAVAGPSLTWEIEPKTLVEQGANITFDVNFSESASYVINIKNSGGAVIKSWSGTKKDPESMTWNTSTDAAPGDYAIVITINGMFAGCRIVTITGPSPCFIATAAYGTPLHEDIDVLRQFRDEYLITNPPGRTFVEIYYSTSPPIADALRNNEGLRTIVRECLIKPLVYISRLFVR